MSQSSHNSGSGPLGHGYREDFGDPAGAAILDEGHVSQLKALVTESTRTLFAELSSIFRRESITRFENLEKAVQNRDAEAVNRLAHSLIGSAASLGARQLQIALRWLEAEAPVGDWQRIETAHAAVVRYRAILLDELKRCDGGRS